jgi:hypothetical protein
MNLLQVAESIKKLPQINPFPGLTVVMILERPMIKAMAILTGCWPELKKDVLLIKGLSTSESRAGICSLYEVGARLPPGEIGARASWYLIQAIAIDGELTEIKGVFVMGEPGREKLAADYAEGLTKELSAKAKATYRTTFYEEKS